MAYKKTTVTGYADLLIQLRDFMVAQGWVVDRDALLGNGRVLIAHAGTNYVSFRGCVNDAPLTDYPGSFVGYGMAVAGLTGFDATLAWDRQPGFFANTSGYGFCEWSTTAGDFAGEVHFFVHADAVAVVMKDSVEWLSVYAGNLEKLGSYPGGQIISAVDVPGKNRSSTSGNFYAENGATAVRADINNDGAVFSGWVGDPYTSAYSYTGRGLSTPFQYPYGPDRQHPHFTWDQLKNSPSAFNRLNVLFPIYMYYDRSDALMTLLGTVKHVYLTRAGQSNPGDPIAYGGVNYHLFPLRADGYLKDYALAFEA